MSDQTGGPVPDGVEPTPAPDPAVPPAAPEGAVPPPSAYPPPAATPPPSAYPPPAATPPPSAYPPPAATPPPGAYPPPAATPPPGAYPPPGGYAAPGPYQPQAAGQPVAIGEAFNYGWTKFQQNLGGVILGVLLYMLVYAVLGGIFYALLLGGSALASGSRDSNVLGAAFGITGLLFLAIMMLFFVVVQAGILRASLEITYGRPISVGTFFQFNDIGKVLLAALLLGLLTGVGYVLCFIPGLIIAFFGQFTLLFVLDKGMSPMDALKSSFSLVNKNLGTVIVLFIAVYVANMIGSFLCGIGALVSVPVGLIATAYVYRRLLGETVAA